MFPRSERNFTPENICNWVYENKESIITWIQPIGQKSHALEVELRKGPALLVFLPQSPLSASQTLSEVSPAHLTVYTYGTWLSLTHACLSLPVTPPPLPPGG